MLLLCKISNLKQIKTLCQVSDQLYNINNIEFQGYTNQWVMQILV